ncbi:ferritin-like fold-containing protein [Subtercola endophyticus]|uniref:ferritin-like fold-containing protein n=1 Tax=Subtercola endophyticus TaxID=2895559 RepID=UPI001E435725|nr:ferritin-like fold-containing protein [Subtercola endophyticus]UFS59920.1 ferritin-like domain-containing protein [Subtercola endophyticus]
MFDVFKRPAARLEVPRLKPRRPADQTLRVNLAEITPEVIPYLGQAAYIQLSIFEALARTVMLAPTVAAKEVLGPASGFALEKHEKLVAELRRLVGESSVVMAQFAPAIEHYNDVVRGSDWYESLTSVYLTAGILDDFFVLLAAGIDGDVGPKVARIVSSPSGREGIETLLGDAISEDATLGSRLAVWGRRLVGDTLLVARSAIHHSGNVRTDEQRIEPVFTELIANHSRRMDGLGLTA